MADISAYVGLRVILLFQASASTKFHETISTYKWYPHVKFLKCNSWGEIAISSGATCYSYTHVFVVLLYSSFLSDFWCKTLQKHQYLLFVIKYDLLSKTQLDSIFFKLFI